MSRDHRILTWATGLAVLLAADASVLAAQDDDGSSGGTYHVAAFAGGGFAGRNVRRAVQVPAFSQAQNGAPVVVPDSVDLIRDGRFDWRPTVSSGVLVTRDLANGFYIGASAYFAFLTEDDSETRPSPGFAFHFGQGDVGLFVGYVFTASHDIALPDGQDRIRVGRDNVPDLRTADTSSFGRLYIGFSGVSLDLTQPGS